ncbi:MAG: hypothetical protein FDZ75_01770 [Actinobacteria bacterium]|nr:MAG: hypothetical protein FDZ75_01770 [Actinomycetota bacterium]
MYNARYHIASLVAVFLALSLGLVLGGLVVRTGTVGRQQAALVEGLRKEFSDLRTENDDLKSNNELLGSYSKAMTDSWSAERLSGKTYVVLASTGRTDGLKAVRAAIGVAGGKAAVVTILKPGLGLDDGAVRSQVASYAGGDGAGIEDRISAALVREWSTPAGARPVTSALTSAGVLTIDGLDASVAASGIVDIAATDGDADPEGVALVKSAAALSLPGIGAELLGKASGVAAACAQAGGSGFDTLGTDVGRYTLIALLSGSEPGLYGVSDDATAAFPEPIAR